MMTPSSSTTIVPDFLEQASPEAKAELREIALVGESASVRRLRSQLERIGPHYRTALLVGERGSGLEDAARRLHTISPVATGPFVACTAEDLVRGGDQPELFYAAQNGTLYLHDVEKLSLAMQAVMMRRLQSLDALLRARKIMTRLIAASRQDLKVLAASGQFRQDLYSRLAVVEIKLAPLRERAEDIGLLCQNIAGGFRDRRGETPRIAPETIERLANYNWPRNLDELREVVEQALTRAIDGSPGEPSIAGRRAIAPEDLPELRAAVAAEPEQQAAPVIERLDDVLRRHVLDVLSHCAGNKVRAAELLGISRSTLYRMLDNAAV